MRLRPRAASAALLLLVACQAAPEAVPADLTVEVVTLRYSEALQTSSTLRGLFEGTPLRVQVDPRTNSVLLAGTERDLQRARDVIERLDVEVVSDDPHATLEVIVLEHASAGEVFGTLRALMKRMHAELALDERTNALLVRAQPESMVQIKQMIAQLDREQ